jgi:hypothetical protein
VERHRISHLGAECSQDDERSKAGFEPRQFVSRCGKVLQCDPLFERDLSYLDKFNRINMVTGYDAILT